MAVLLGILTVLLGILAVLTGKIPVKTAKGGSRLINYSAIKTLKDKFQVPIGYSGHEAGVSPSVMAVVLGAQALERHVTLDRAMYGSDQAASLEPQGMRNLCSTIRKVNICLGDGVKRIIPGELQVAKKLRYWNEN